ncbi:hypothetical protein AC579_405 [Pseudocercospora musae]|uniref:N-acetyltransferase domain-containing protein n=1 Tax=Pseudocercospora musae TaxID=113226 RepID=A0A139GYE8_9PEZI|nr:hypothetical protein AC579_405 [Pseudocercospora musae]
MSLVTATEVDLPSLSTIVQRSFHKTNTYFRTTFPDTPLMRKWFKDLFQDAIQDPEYQLLVVREEYLDSSTVQGIILLNRGSEHAAVFKRHPPTSDHDSERYQAMLESEKSNTYTAEQPVNPHFGIELLGVSDEAKGRGIANDEGMEIFVTANVGVRTFYEREGFVTERSIVLDGEDGYGQVRMIYRGR